NCKIQYDSAFPWFPKYTVAGPKASPLDATNWNLPEMFKTARAGDYFLPQGELAANVPSAKDLWPFALRNGAGLTWAFGQYCYPYRTDLVTPVPSGFKSFWEDRFRGSRATYITSNTLFMAFFLMSSLIWGGDQTNIKAGIDAMRRAMPMKI